MFTLFLFFVFLATENDLQSLVKKLGNDNYRVREKAQKEIEKIIDFDIYIELRKINNNEKTALEIRRRVEVIVKKYESISTTKSKYKFEIKGYPKYPWIWEGLPEEYTWNGLNGWEIAKKYLSHISEGESDHHPDWLRHRKATELWVEDRIHNDFSELIKIVKSEKELREKMSIKMAVIQTDMDMMRVREDEYWERRGEKNPLMIEKK